MSDKNIRRIIYIVFALIILLSVQGNTLFNSGTSSEDELNLEGPYDVVRVVDGDTLILSIDDVESKVRLIGVDTPESVHPDKAKNSAEGKNVSKFVKSLLNKKQVYLEYDVSKFDKYDRVLAYVYLDDKKTMLNKMLIEKGFALTMTIQPNAKYSDAFYKSQVSARKSKVGFWKTGFFSNK